MTPASSPAHRERPDANSLVTAAAAGEGPARWLRTLRANWRVYAIDGALLATLLALACAYAVLIGHPALPVRRAVPSDVGRRALMGAAMGLTVIALIYSPWGRRSGALMNPAVAVSHWRTGRIGGWDALFYALAQAAGAAAGVALMAAALGPFVRHDSVNYVVTAPGRWGVAAAWLGEFAIAFAMMFVVTGVNAVPRLRPFAGCFAGLMVAVFITVEGPLSGPSLNPARTFGSAVVAGAWDGWWVYATAPLLGMLAGIEVRRGRVPTGRPAACGKFTHDAARCFVRCDCDQR